MIKLYEEVLIMNNQYNKDGKRGFMGKDLR